MTPQFERSLLERAAEDAAFRATLLAAPKDVLERELSNAAGRHVRLPEGTVVHAIEANSSTLFLVLPEATAARRRPALPIIASVLQLTGAESVYGLFMGYVNDVWVRAGLFRGTPVKDVLKEIA